MYVAWSGTPGTRRTEPLTTKLKVQENRFTKTSGWTSQRLVERRMSMSMTVQLVQLITSLMTPNCPRYAPIKANTAAATVCCIMMDSSSTSDRQRCFQTRPGQPTAGGSTSPERSVPKPAAVARKYTPVAFMWSTQFEPQLRPATGTRNTSKTATHSAEFRAQRRPHVLTYSSHCRSQLTLSLNLGML